MYRDLLKDSISDRRVVLLGAARQEILSDRHHAEQYERLQQALRAFPNQVLETKDYELAAESFNLCRQQGIRGANTDFLISDASVRRQYTISTTDNDFTHFGNVLTITRYTPLIDLG